MKSLFNFGSKRGILLSIVMLALLLTGCSATVGGDDNEPSKPEAKPTELNFRTDSVGMTYCEFNWNWLDGCTFDSVVLSTKEDFSSDRKTIGSSFWYQSLLPYKISELKPGTDYYLQLSYRTRDYETKTKVISFHTNDEGPLDKLIIKYEKSSKCVKISYDYVRDTAKIKVIKIYRKIQSEEKWTLIAEGSVKDSKVFSGFEDYEYTPNVENFYKIELYDGDGNSLGDDVTSERSVTPEDADDVLGIKVTARGYSYLDLLWDYSLYDSYNITFKNSGTSDPVEYASKDLTAGKSIHFYLPRNKIRGNYSNSITFTIECYKNAILEKTVKRSFEINKTGNPEDLKSELGNNKITLKWNSYSPGNDAIAKIYRRTNSTAEYELIESKKYWASNSNEFAAFDDETFVAGTTNYYKVELYEADGLEAGNVCFGSAEVSCDANSKCSITFDLGDKRDTNYDKEQFEIHYFDKGEDISKFNKKPYVFVSEDYKKYYQFDSTTWLDENGSAFDFNTTISKNIILKAVYRPLKPSVTKYLTDGDKIYLRWNKTIGFTYKVEYGKIGATTLEALNCGTENNETLKNLEEGQKYTINIYAVSEDNICSEPAAKEITAGAAQNTDWLVIMYLDGDNNLNNPIYLDMNEVEYGLSKFKTTDHIRVIALWDGYKGDNDNPASKLWGPRTTHLLELGPDPREDEGTLLELSDETFDWSFTADWLSEGEVDMSSKDTLQNYLEWVKAHFSGTKTILQFSNHGAGPRSLLPGGDKYARRAMCWDDTDGNKDSFLKTSDVSEVLKSVDLKNGSKIDLIIEDVCLGSTIEEAYQYKDYAQYFIGSPNTVPGYGLDYNVFIPSMTSNASVLKISKDILQSYKASYALSNAAWKKILDDYNSLPAFQGANALNAKGISLIYDGACGLTLVDLSKLDDVRTSINDLAYKLYLLKEKTISIGDTNDINFLDFVREYTVTPGNPIFYQGSYTWLYDIGAIVDAISEIFYTTEITDQLNLGTLDGTIPFLQGYISGIEDVKMSLYQAIPASWRDGYQRPSYDTSASKYNTSNTWIGTDIDGNYYGLSICGGTLEVSQSGQEVTILDGKYPDFYTTDLAFGSPMSSGTDTTNYWNELLKLWFPAN